VVLGLALLVFVIFPSSAAIEIAWFRAGIGAMTVGMVVWLTGRNLPNVRVADMARQVARPTFAALAMAAGVVCIETMTPNFAPWVRLAVMVAGGAVAYAACLATLWQLAGRPEGAERWILDKLQVVVVTMGRS
jgi:hypothetical protein